MQIPDSNPLPEGIYQYIDLWQLFADYKGEAEGLHKFSFPTFIEEESRLLLYFSNDLMIKKVGSNLFSQNLTFDTFNEIKNINETFAPLAENCTIIPIRELNVTAEWLKAMAKTYFKLFIGKSGGQFIDYFFDGPVVNPHTDNNSAPT